MNDKNLLETVTIIPEEVTVFAKWCGRLWGGGRRDATHVTEVDVWVSQVGGLRLRAPSEHEKGWLRIQRAKVKALGFVRLSYDKRGAQGSEVVGLARMSDPENVIGIEGVTTLDELIGRCGGDLPTEAEWEAVRGAFDGKWTAVPASTGEAAKNPSRSSGERSELFAPLDAVVAAATALRENWFQGAMAQAHYRDKLVDSMVAARLLASGS